MTGNNKLNPELGDCHYIGVAYSENFAGTTDRHHIHKTRFAYHIMVNEKPWYARGLHSVVSASSLEKAIALFNQLNEWEIKTYRLTGERSRFLNRQRQTNTRR
jgi:hypothetical protein